MVLGGKSSSFPCSPPLVGECLLILGIKVLVNSSPSACQLSIHTNAIEILSHEQSEYHCWHIRDHIWPWYEELKATKLLQHTDIPQAVAGLELLPQVPPYVPKYASFLFSFLGRGVCQYSGYTARHAQNLTEQQSTYSLDASSSSITSCV